MVKLNANQYDRCIEPLKGVAINTLFAQAVIYKQISGSVYVDCEKEPKVFYIAHPYGMSLLFGDTENEVFNKELFQYLINKNETRNKTEWLQVYPNSWNKKIEIILGTYLVKNNSINKDSAADTKDKKIVEYSRANFAFDVDAYKEYKRELDRQDYEIVCTDKEIFHNMQGSVIPKYFWRDEEQFQKAGLGYSLICDGVVAATAFSAFWFENQLEIGIETSDKYRGKGFAQYVCSKLIDYCIENGQEPVWGCRKENIASYKLAQKLGFVPSICIPYYQLIV